VSKGKILVWADPIFVINSPAFQRVLTIIAGTTRNRKISSTIKSLNDEQD
jgi:hypothetical protein